MTDLPAEIVHRAAGAEEPGQSGLLPQLRMMFRALWASDVRNVLFALGLGVFVVIAGTTYGQVRLNRWNQPFYNALAHRDHHEFLVQLGVFGIIIGALLVLNVAQRWLTEMLKLRLRDGLVRDLVALWMRPGRAFRLASAGAIGVNPDQRMHEDARHLTELSADLGVGLLQSSILLVSFVEVLWGLSKGFSFSLGGRTLEVPGFMVWAAIVYAGTASLVSYFVGRPLVRRNADRYAREADLRFALVRVNEHLEAITLAGGEEDEARRIRLALSTVLDAMRRLVTGLTELTWVTAGYGWLTLIAPILVAAGPYFAGRLSFGGLMMAAGAFTQVQSSLRWFIDNFSIIADWRATLLRVASFRRALAPQERPRGAESAITVTEGEPGQLSAEHLEIAYASGTTVLAEGSFEIHTGERVLISGPPGAGKTLLFQALAGLWTLGSGHIVVPKRNTLFFMPRTAYLPPGTLREALAYPRAVADYAAEIFAHALERVGLARLVRLLDADERWDHRLGEEEQQQVVLARALIHRPDWLVIDDVLDDFDEETLRHVQTVFRTDFASAGIIHIGRCRTHHPIFGRELHLVRKPRRRKAFAETAGGTPPWTAQPGFAQ